MMEYKGFGFDGANMVYRGGPVNESALVMIHTDDWYSTNTMQISSGIAISSDELMIQKVAMQNQPTLWRMYQGVSAWAPKQLEAELQVPNSWLIADVPYVDFLFNNQGSNQWMEAIEICSKQTISNFF